MPLQGKPIATREYSSKAMKSWKALSQTKNSLLEINIGPLTRIPVVTFTM